MQRRVRSRFWLLQISQGSCREILKHSLQVRMLCLKSTRVWPKARSSSSDLLSNAKTKRVAVRGPTPGKPRKCWIKRVIGGGKFIPLEAGRGRATLLINI